VPRIYLSEDRLRSFESWDDQAVALLDSEAQRRLAALRVSRGLAVSANRLRPAYLAAWARWSKQAMFAKLEAWFNTFFLGYAARVSGTWLRACADRPCAGHHLHRDLRPGSHARRSHRARWHFRLEDGQGRRDPVVRSARPVLQRQCRGLGYRPAGRLGTLFVAPQSGRSRHRVRGAWTWPTRQRTSSLPCSGRTPECSGSTWYSPAFCSRWAQRSSLSSARSSGLLGKLILTFALAIGPLAILCLLFKSTARFFDSWLSFVLSAVVLSWFVFFALGCRCTSRTESSGHR
jgi:hypothetical protein